MAEIYLFENSKSEDDLPTPEQELAGQVAFMLQREKGGEIRKMLINLGWTPPDNSQNSPTNTSEESSYETD